MSFHALRHTHASMLIDDGVNVVKISQRLGHNNPTVTLKVAGAILATAPRQANAATKRKNPRLNRVKG